MSNDTRSDTKLCTALAPQTPDPLPCDCSAERERMVAELLVRQLSTIGGVARIYSSRTGGRIDFAVEVDDLWSGEAMERAHEAFYGIRRRGVSDGVDLLVLRMNPQRRFGPEHNIWFERQNDTSELHRKTIALEPNG